jgi:hypothetical protein
MLHFCQVDLYANNFLFLFSVFSVNAHEFTPSRYPTDIRFHTYMKKWLHEIEHTLGLNETNDGTQSVMRQGRGSTLGWENYWKPQTHDTSDLTRFNYKSWFSSNVPTMD